MSTNSKGISTTKDPFEGVAGAPAATSNGNPSIGGTAGNTITGAGDPYNMAALTGGQQAGQMPQGQQQGGTPQGTGHAYEAGQYSGQADPMAGLFPSSQASNFSFSQSSPQGNYTPSPYLDQQANAIKTQYGQQFNEQVLPGLRDKFVGAGGLGGSRQGIAEGLAAGRSQQGLAGALANLYGNDYEQSQNRSLQAGIAGNSAAIQGRGMELQYDLGRLNSERGFYSTNRGQDLQQMGLGAGLMGQGNLGLLNQGSGIYGLGQQENQAPWQAIQNYNGILQPGYNLGGSVTQTNPGPNQGQSALGGAASGAAIGSSFGPWGTAIGAGVGAIGGYYSDRRLKENIKKVGKLDSGLNIYEYNYKAGGPTTIGVMAQEAEKKFPDAVGLLNGFKTVNYGLLQ